MAYMSQERKKSFAPAIKALCKKYGFKHTLSVEHHSTIQLNLWSGKYDLVKLHNDHAKIEHDRRWPESEFYPSEYFEVQRYCREWFEGDVKEFFEEAFKILNKGNHDNSDIMTDYFDVGWYVDINIGKWNKPYKFITE